jgi:hypothetical protein
MQPSLILFLVLLLLLAAGTYYLGFVLRPTWAWHSQAGFLITIGVLIPTVVLVLALQQSARGRLARLGVRVHPGLGPSLGVATGIGRNSTWLFRTTAPAETILAYYRADSTHPGWSLIEASPAAVVLSREGERLSILAAGVAPDVVVAIEKEVRRR